MKEKQYTAPQSNVIMVGTMELICMSGEFSSGGKEYESIDISSDDGDTTEKDDDGYSYGD